MKQDQLILVGFGKHNLNDMLDWRGTEKEEELIFAPDNWPPRYKTETACSLAEIESFLEYVAWATSLLKDVNIAIEHIDGVK